MPVQVWSRRGISGEIEGGGHGHGHRLLRFHSRLSESQSLKN